MTKDYREGYQDGFKDGFKAGQDSGNVSRSINIPSINIPTVFPSKDTTSVPTTQCYKCGMVWKGAMAYSCPHMNCPIQPKVTS